MCVVNPRYQRNRKLMEEIEILFRIRTQHISDNVENIICVAKHTRDEKTKPPLNE